VSQEAGAALTVMIGALLVRLSATGAHQRYVRSGMGPWLILSGIVLIAIGGFVLARSLLRRPERVGAGRVEGHEHSHGEEGHAHGHHGESIAWLLVIPVVTLLLVAPPSLGSFALGRSVTVRQTQPKGTLYPPLPVSAEPRPTTLREFDDRAADGGAAAFNGATVELTGFAAGQGDPAGEGFLLARYQIACCAADAQAAIVRVVGAVPPIKDQWVTVVGAFQAGGTDAPRLRASSVTPVPTPDDPYET